MFSDEEEARESGFDPKGEDPDYVVNSLVDIDGGTGNDRTIIVGTELDDSYVVTDGNIFGGGLTVKYTNIETLEVTMQEGNDLVSILSTNPSVVTNCYGALGSDRFRITPRSVAPVTSKNLRGHRGILEHAFSSADSSYHGLLVQGIAVNILDNDGTTGYLNVVEDEAVHVLTEGSTTDSFDFWIYPTRRPLGDVTVDVVPPSDINFLRHVNLALDGTPITTSAISTTFGTNDMTPRRVTVTHNPLSTPLQITELNLLIKNSLSVPRTTDINFESTEQSILPIDIKLLPSPLNPIAKAVSVIEPDRRTAVAEGPEGYSDSYDVYLRPCDMATKTNTVLSVIQSVQGEIIVSPSSVSGSTWGSDCKVTISVSAVNDTKQEGDHFVTLRHNVTTPSGAAILLFDNSTLYAGNVLVRIYDDDIAGVMIDESLAVTATAEIRESDKSIFNAFGSHFYEDSYRMRLTKQPAEDVMVDIVSMPVAR